MEDKIALINCLALLYYTSKSATDNTYSSLIKKITSSIKTPAAVGDADDRASLIGLRKLVSDLNTGELKFDRKSVLQKIRIFSTFDHTLLQVAEEAMPEDVGSDTQILDKLGSLASDISLFSRRKTVHDAVRRASFELNTEDSDFKSIISGLRESLAANDTAANGGKLPSEVQAITSDDVEGMQAVLEETKKQLSGTALRTGWKGINEMMGCNKGIVPGELWLMPALPHNGKTTFSLLTLLSFAFFNDPKLFAPEGKQAMLLDISLENDLNVNIPIVYRAVYEHFEQKPLNVEDIDPVEGAKYIVQKVNESGWKIAFERHINTDFEVDTMATIFAKYEAKGNHIVACRPDYLGTIKRTGLGNGTVGSDVREVYRRARNITSPRKCALLAPHQLSPDAKKLKAMDPFKYVRQLPGKGMYDGCTTVDNEADGEMYLGITPANGVDYVEVQRGKHRTIINTPEKLRYVVMKFADLGILPWDVDTENDYTLRSVSQGGSGGFGGDLFGGMGM